MIRLLYFSARGKLPLSSLLNALDSSGTPVGCVRSDAQTQASHWLELEDTRPFFRFPPLLSSLVFVSSRWEDKPARERQKRSASSLSPSLSLYWVKERAEIGTGHFVWRGNYLSHEASRICPVYRGARSAAPFQWISIQWKYPGNLTIVNSHQLKKLRSNNGFCFPRRGKTMILAVFYVLLPVLGKFKLIRTSNCSLRIDYRVSSNI